MGELYIDGEWTQAAAGGRRDVVNPYDASVITTVAEADSTDVDRAVRAARRAFDEEDWANTPTRHRADLLLRVHDLLLRDKEEIARTETLDTGKTLAEGRFDVEDVANAFRYYAELAGKDGGRVVDVGPDVLSRVVYQPVGVCALIAPWNYPLLQASWKVAPALAAGNTFVLKPSETRRTTPESRPVVDKQLATAATRPRHGEPLAARALRAVRRTVSASAAREVAEATATAEVLQQAVTTGRQIAVTSIRGGSGKTTVTALLGTTYAHYRQDPVLVVEADPALGSLPLRLGAESLRWTTGDLAEVVEPQMSLLDVTGYLVQLPDNAWLLPGSQGQVGAMLDTKGYERVMVSLRRYFGVTVVDCETLPAEVARTALSAAQARVLTTPATLEGVASTHAVLEWMRALPRDITASTVVVLIETAPHTGLDLDKATERLKTSGVSVRVLPYDRHLAAGGPIRTDLLARPTRQAATRLAAEVFQLSQKRR
ncbi:aldehyde dehydrogenase family protein [Streptomyces triticisoli]|uniref:aldehyde dehydrogenase family protein n=1 Tax=Streptomyces triticisoli TaxID=2182797 RepID=UPI000DDB5EAE|nr:aldehyde dehydrogenase family protein [Streptomyces triticisoli]